jgi:hypothetical protein
VTDADEKVLYFIDRGHKNDKKYAPKNVWND